MQTSRGAQGFLHATAHKVRFAQAVRRWERERDGDVEAALEQPSLAASVSRLAAQHRQGLSPDRPVHVVIVPSEGPSFPEYQPAAGNIYYEIIQSLRESIGDDAVSVLDVPSGEAPDGWHARLLDLIHDTQATHVLGHAEADPASAGQVWTWDVPWTALSRHWDGAMLGVMFDSAFEWISAKSRRLAGISARFMVVDICMPMDGSMVRGRTEVGPVNMPISRQSVALIDERIAGLEPEFDVSFIGALYPYRVELIERMREAGISVAVNPHRADETRDFADSRANLPSYLDYMAGLRRSRMTINFSQSSAGPVAQLKTRVLEATLVGTLLLTDDVDRTSRFWTIGEEYAYFASPQDLPRVVSDLLADPDRVQRMAAAGRNRARGLAHTSFWEGADAGLRRRGLRPILPTLGAK